jgi:D-lactate dehydrogenase (cytochrome)
VGAVVRHDVAVPVARVPDLIARAAALLAAEYPQARLIPFGHVGDGNLHLNALFPLDDPGLAAARHRLPGLIFDLVQDLGGSISAEHGIGRLKRAELHARKDPLEIELMRRLKAALDPEEVLNPGVIV